MNRPVIAALLFMAVVMGGCAEPADTEAAEPVPYAPEGHILPPDEGEGGAGSTPEAGWFVWFGRDWSPSLPATGAVLNLSIQVEGAWHRNFPSFEESGWMFRLHAEIGRYDENNVYRKVRDLPAPVGTEWYRNYTLHGVVNATVSHPTSFYVGDLAGEAVAFRLTSHKVYESGYWTAHECLGEYPHQDGRYVSVEGASAECHEVCAFREISRPCPWSGKPGHSSPPPPEDW